MIVVLSLIGLTQLVRAEARRWHINLGGAYGIENFSLDKPNEFVRAFNKWT